MRRINGLVRCFAAVVVVSCTGMAVRKILLGEQIVDGCSHRYLFYRFKFERIAEVEIGNKVAIEHQIAIIIVRHVLLTDVLTLQSCRKAMVIESESIVEYHVG